MNDQSRIYLDNILRRMPGSVYWKDRNGVYLGCNQMQAEMAGLESPDDMIGKTDSEMPWKEISGILAEVDQRIMNTGVSEEIIERPTLSSGIQLIMLTNKSPLYDLEGKIIGIVGTSLDITALKQAEERERRALKEAATLEQKRKAEEEAKKAVMVWAGSISHDLRGPLLSLRFLSHSLEAYLKAAASDDITLKDCADLNKSPQRIEVLIQQMHAYIDTNLKSIKNSTLSSVQEDDLVICKSYKGLNNALDSYPFRLSEKQLIQKDTSYYFDFMGNPVLFIRILFNLINNSLHQIHQNGKGQIFLTTEKGDEFNVIRFRDTAGGASFEIVEHIFDGYRTTKESGTGIGLSFCKLTMESFGGSMSCNAQEGDYMEFVLSFPKIPDQD
jgi:PAS domain S-box-containing protein